MKSEVGRVTRRQEVQGVMAEGSLDISVSGGGAEWEEEEEEWTGSDHCIVKGMLQCEEGGGMREVMGMDWEKAEEWATNAKGTQDPRLEEMWEGEEGSTYEKALIKMRSFWVKKKICKASKR